MSLTYIAVLIAVLLACAPLMSSISTRQREKALQRYAKQMNLSLSPEVRPRVIRRINAYERASLIGGVGGSAVGFGVGLTLPQAPDSGTWVPLAVFVGLGMGMMLTTVTTATIGALRPAPGRRVARASTPTIVDYVPPLERRYAVAALGCAGLALIGAVVALATGVVRSDEMDAAGVLYSGGAVFAYLGAVSYVIAQVLSRRILDAGQPASTAQELAWDDALRASTLRGLLLLPGSLATLSVVFTFVRLAAHATYQADFVGLVGGAALIAFVCVVGCLVVIDARSRPSQHYWRRLWRATHISTAAP